MKILHFWFLLAFAVALLSGPRAHAQGAGAEQSAWEAARDCASVQAYIDAFPSGRFLTQARARMIDLGCADPHSPDPPAPSSPADDESIERGIPPQPRPPPGPPRPRAERERITAAMVELLSGQRRLGRNGGSAVVLLSAAANDGHRNAALCRGLFSQFEQASVEDVIANRRIDGGAIRPIYWMAREAGEETCRSRIARYDRERARRLKLRFGLEGRGPYLLVVRENDAQAGVIDLSDSNERQMFDAVAYFALDFSQADDVWERPPPPSQVALSMARLSGATASLVRAPFVLAASYFASCDTRVIAMMC